jgi:hypothetical protein
MSAASTLAVVVLLTRKRLPSGLQQRQRRRQQ